MLGFSLISIDKEYESSDAIIKDRSFGIANNHQRYTCVLALSPETKAEYVFIVVKYTQPNSHISVARNSKCFTVGSCGLHDLVTRKLIIHTSPPKVGFTNAGTSTLEICLAPLSSAPCICTHFYCYVGPSFASPVFSV